MESGTFSLFRKRTASVYDRLLFRNVKMGMLTGILCSYFGNTSRLYQKILVTLRGKCSRLSEVPLDQLRCLPYGIFRKATHSITQHVHVVVLSTTGLIQTKTKHLNQTTQKYSIVVITTCNSLPKIRLRKLVLLGFRWKLQLND